MVDLVQSNIILEAIQYKYQLCGMFWYTDITCESTVHMNALKY